MKLTFFFIVVIMTTLLQLGEKKGWRGIVPLRSTRSDVERELGPKNETCECYQTENEIVHISYATGPCTGALSGWNVPANTVLSISVSPRKKLPFSSVESNVESFVKTSDDTLTTYYGNGERGIRYAVSTSGLLTETSYMPSINDNSLRCAGFPLTDGGVTAYAPYDVFPYRSLDDITSRLGEFAVRLQKLPDYQGYIVVYATRNTMVPGVATFADKARAYLIDTIGTEPRVITAINGGYRERPTVEIFLIPKSWPAPIPTPTIAGILK